jgi:hypothetical protein
MRLGKIKNQSREELNIYSQNGGIGYYTGKALAQRKRMENERLPKLVRYFVINQRNTEI